MTEGTADPQHDPFLSPQAGSTELWLIRHGDALPDAADVHEGDYQVQPLSQRGQQQALALATRLRHSPICALYSSPILRAVRTAQPTANALNLPVLLDDDLREVQVGPIGPALPPYVSAEDRARILSERMDAIAAFALGIGVWSALPGSEDGAALRARITSALRRIASQHTGQCVAVISHGGAINAFIAQALGIERDYFFPCANTSISTVRLHGERTLLLGLNDIGHLRAT